MTFEEAEAYALRCTSPPPDALQRLGDETEATQDIPRCPSARSRVRSSGS